MITRGYYIGQIIDELSSISEQIKNRDRLGLTDINAFSENFVRDILNICLDTKLLNLNAERSNAPGLDLGDLNEKIAFQVTSTKLLAKVHATLDAAAPFSNDYSKIRILILQEKQGSYSLDDNKCKAFNFSADDIWDWTDVLKIVMNLKIDKLQELHNLVSKEVARVKIELEIPDSSGNFPTSISSHIEAIPSEKFNGIDWYYDSILCANGNYGFSKAKVANDFNQFIKSLKSLPRITREFYALMIERGQLREDGNGCNWQISDDYIRRICKHNDLDGEIQLLSECALCWRDVPEPPDDSCKVQETVKWRLSATSNVKDELFLSNLIDYMKNSKQGVKSFIVALDFSPLNANI